MKQIRECAEKHFDFLKQFGYVILDDNDIDVISFRGKDNRIDITFSSVSYELTCNFVDENKSFSLQDGLTFLAIEDYRGFYQLANKEEFEKGICYLAKAVENLFERIDISDSLNFLKIYQYSIDTHKELLQKYYLENDLKKAEDYWKKKEYAKAKELFEKNIDYLSNSQKKKLEYITNHMI